jgi:hypothetical protein
VVMYVWIVGRVCWAELHVTREHWLLYISGLIILPFESELLHGVYTYLPISLEPAPYTKSATALGMARESVCRPTSYGMVSIHM